MPLRLDDPRLSGTWRLIAATSGILDHRPRVQRATVVLHPPAGDDVQYDLSYSTPNGTHDRSGILRARPVLRRPRSWPTFWQWLVIGAARPQLLLSPSETVLAVATPGSIVVNSASLLLANAETSDERAWSTVLDDMTSLGLTTLSVRELDWRIKASGTDPRRYTETSPA